MAKFREQALTFDDVLLVPQKSEILPKDTSLRTRLTKNIELITPFVSADMDTVTEAELALSMAKEGGIGILHKNMDAAKQVEEVVKVKNAEASSDTLAADKAGRPLVGASIGVGDEALKRAEKLLEADVDVLVISTAHGHSKGVIETVAKIRKRFPQAEIMAGNVVTKEGTRDLIEAGASAIKVGVGPGSICTTRIVAGVGVPQLSAVKECVEEADKDDVPIIADGGIKYSGDIVKALAVGASTIMAGGLFAGSKEAPGEVIEVNGRKYKSYRGMGSLGALKVGSQDRYAQKNSTKKKLVAEGVEGRIPYVGTVSEIIFQLVGGIRSGLGYLGAKDISELQKKAIFVPITGASLRESHPHDIKITKEAPNYNP
ncbi:IMP dehydrogenase [Patescibacteria group bacterium]|nr:IMP dehydrogenase [Patescibacteria group bacterium]